MTYKNTFRKGITKEEALGLIPAEQGIAQHRGVPKTSGEQLNIEEVYGGVPMHMPSAAPVDDGSCKATTKKGKPCKGYRITDSNFCVGHSR